MSMIFALALALNVPTINLPSLENEDPATAQARGMANETQLFSDVKAKAPTQTDPNRTQPTLRLYRAFDAE